MKVLMLKETNWKDPKKKDDVSLKEVGKEYEVPTDVGRRWCNRRPPIAEAVNGLDLMDDLFIPPAPPSKEPPTPPELTVAELKGKAKALGIEKHGNMKKNDLIAAIAKAEQEAEAVKAKEANGTETEEEASAELVELKAQAAELGIEGFEEMDETQLAETIEKVLAAE